MSECELCSEGREAPASRLRILARSIAPLLDGEVTCYQESSFAFFSFVGCAEAPYESEVQAASRFNVTNTANPYCWSFRRVEFICS